MSTHSGPVAALPAPAPALASPLPALRTRLARFWTALRASTELARDPFAAEQDRSQDR